MKRVTPQVFLIGETRIIPEGLDNFLAYIGAKNWRTDAKTDSEKLTEVMGRICYNSFVVGLNPNIRKIREGNRVYIGNIEENKHGSVLEHAQINFVFADVSRVFTDELERHHAGIGISQESLRYRRLTNLNMWAPSIFEQDDEIIQIFTDVSAYLEGIQLKLADKLHLDDPNADFKYLKEATSAIRRLAPMGLGTVVGWSCNLRALRWVLENRTGPGVEEEMRYVFGKVGEIVVPKYSAIFQDFEVEVVNKLPCYKPKYSKI
jgi:thymidylate synthase (FAD)